MCIRKMGKFAVSHTEIGVGYKWVTKWREKYYSSNFPEGWTYKSKVWNKAKDRGQSKEDVGFHIYDLYEEARLSKYNEPMGSYWKPKATVVTKRNGAKGVLLQVRYKDFHTGYGDGLTNDLSRMIVAKHMQIIMEVKLNNKKQE